MTGTKTNERPGTRAQVRYLRVSAYKAREVLDLIRNKHVADADQILQFVERDVAMPVRKCLASAVANAENNDSQDPEALYVSACYADEGPTLKRWRPRARGRATRVRKRTTHVTIIVSRLPEAEIRRRAERESAAQAATGGRRPTQSQAAARRSRVARSRQRERAVETPATEAHDHDDTDVDGDATPALEGDTPLGTEGEEALLVEGAESPATAETHPETAVNTEGPVVEIPAGDAEAEASDTDPEAADIAEPAAEDAEPPPGDEATDEDDKKDEN